MCTNFDKLRLTNHVIHESRPVCMCVVVNGLLLHWNKNWYNYTRNVTFYDTLKSTTRPCQANAISSS